MNHEPLLPPIASPHGAGTVVPQGQPEPEPGSMRIDVTLGFVARCRYALIEWFTPTMAAIVVLFLLVMAFGAIPDELLSGLTIVLPVTAFSSILTRLFSRRRFTIQISASGLRKHAPSYNTFYGPNRNAFFHWSQFIWVIECGGDLWLASLANGCFIPREAFASRAESHELARILRELKRSKGSSWQNEWNGRIFGLHTETGEALSSPR